MRQFLLILLRLFGALLWFSLTPVMAAPASTQGPAIIIGGALRFDNAAVWQRLVEESGGQGARWLVFATASSKPERVAAQVVEILSRHGALAEAMPVAPRLEGVDLQKNLHDQALIAKVAAASGLYFSGGAQELIVDTLQPGGQPTEMLKAIRAAFQRGAVVAGTSAGAAIMSRTMFRDPPEPLQVLKGQLREGFEVDLGLGFVGADLFVDQHFLRRGRIGRMLPLMLAHGYSFGLGVEENSAVLVRGDVLEVIGAKGALLVDLRQATSDSKLGAFNLRNASLSYLDHGDRHDLRTGISSPSAMKLQGQRVDPAASDFKPDSGRLPFYMDILGDSTIVAAMAKLIDSPAPELRGLAVQGLADAADTQPDLGFEFRLYKGAGSIGWCSSASGAEECTLLNLRLDVLPLQLTRPFYRLMR